MAEEGFSKYRERGAYHWEEAGTSLTRSWPYTRSRMSWVAAQCKGASSVLEIGCGDGALLGKIARGGARVVGVDSEPEGIVLARAKFDENGLEGEFHTELDALGSRRFDAVVLAEVIEHVDSPGELLELVKRHLAAHGRFVMTTPIRLLERSPDPHHVHEFWPEELKTLLHEHFDDVQAEKLHAAWLIDLMCWTLRGRRPWAIAANLFHGITGVELLDRLRSPMGIYWTQAAVCRGGREGRGAR